MNKILLKILVSIFSIYGTLKPTKSDAQYAIVTTPQQLYNFDASKVTIAPDIKISPSDATSITDAKVSIGIGFQSGDILSYNGTLPTNISQSYNATIGTLTFTGTLSAAEWVNVLKNVQFSNASGSTDLDDRKITFTLTNTVMSTNGHFYTFVPGTELGYSEYQGSTETHNFISWNSAFTQAKNTRFNGLQGYLATITSKTENDLIVNELKGNGWIGATSSPKYTGQTGIDTTGYKQYTLKWIWADGPESGTFFYNGQDSIPGQYQN